MADDVKVTPKYTLDITDVKQSAAKLVLKDVFIDNGELNIVLGRTRLL